MTQNRSVITAGQFFILLFVGRAGLTAVYSSGMSGAPSLWSFILPLVIMLPLGMVLLLPSLVLSSKSESPLLISNSGTSGIGGKILLLGYGAYFLFSALYYLSALLDFLRDDLPVGVEPKVIIVLILCGCVYAAAKGIEAVARLALPVLALEAIAAVLLFAFLLPDFSPLELPEISETSAGSVTDGTLFLISRLGACASLPILAGNIKGRTIRGGALWLAVSTVTIVWLVTLFTGTAGAYLGAKKFQVFRVIDGSGALQKAEPLFIVLAVCSSFCGLALFITASSAALRRSFNSIGNIKPALICGAILLALGIFLPEESVSVILRSKQLTAALTVVFLTVIPTGILIFRRLRTFSLNRKTKVPAAARLLLIFVMIVIFTLSAASCTALQLNQRIIVQGIGIDVEGAECRLTLIALNTAHPEMDNSTSIIYSSGENVEEAISKLERERGKSLLLEHCLFVMLNKNAAVSGRRVFDYLTGTNGMPKTANLLVSEGAAGLTMSTALNELGYTSEDVSLLTDSKAIDQQAAHCSLMEFIAAEQTGKSVTLPIVMTDTKNSALAVDTERSVTVKAIK